MDYILIADNMDDAIENGQYAIASEHLEIVTKNPFEVMMKVRNAGALFWENTAAEAAGRLFCRTEPCTCRRMGPHVSFPPLPWMIL